MYDLRQKQDKTMTWPIVKVWSTPKTILNCHNLSGLLQFVMKTRQNNDMIDCIGVVYAKTKTKLLGPI